ncbi:MAG: M20/M25/M40 family metallo-hydrolase [Deinococcales bacterium]
MTLQDAYALETNFLASLQKLVEIESPTHDKAACDRLADHLEQRLLADGWQVERLKQSEVGDQLVAVMGEGKGDSLLLCHYDTVWPVATLKTMPLSLRMASVMVRVVDMKAGINLALHALEQIKAQGRRLRGKVTLLLSSDEETGSQHSRELIERLALEHERVLVLEPCKDDGALKIGRKGTAGYQLTFQGKSAHAGNNPKDGASALRELAHFLFFVEALGDEEAATSANLTVAKGGSVSNVIAEEARAQVDVRVLKLEEFTRIDRAVKGYHPQDARVSLDISGGLNRPPLEPTPVNLRLFKEAQVKAEALGLKLEGAVVGGGSDGNFTSALGVATLDGLGGAGAGPHARHEHIRIADTLDRLALLVALLSAEMQ